MPPERITKEPTLEERLKNVENQISGWRVTRLDYPLDATSSSIIRRLVQDELDRLLGLRDTSVEPTVVTNLQTFVTSSASPGGSTQEVQFNDAGAFGADSHFKWDKTNDILYLSSNATIKPAAAAADTDGETITVQAADGGSTLGSGGALTLQAGTGASAGNGGDVTINGGEASGASTNAGDVVVNAGSNSSTGWGGSISLEQGVSSTDAKNGGVVLGNGAGVTRSDSFFFDSVSTTDATLTTVLSTRLAGLLNGSTVNAGLLVAKVVGRRTGGSAGAANDMATYILAASVKTASTLTTTSVLYSYEDQAGWNADFAMSSNDVLIQVTGAANNNITWQAELSVFF